MLRSKLRRLKQRHVFVLGALALGLSACANGGSAPGEAPVQPSAISAAQETSPSAPPAAKPAKPDPNSKFIGRYNGGSFETAMGMELAADGTFGWGLSVGALDMRARGTWDQEGEFVILTSTPKPVPPEFNWLGLEKNPGAPMVKVVWASNAKPFQYATVLVDCADGARLIDQVPAEGWSPPNGECPKPVALRLEESIYDVQSAMHRVDDLGWTPGSTITFAFERNDLGVADFTGMIGVLEDNVLKFAPSPNSDPRLGQLELRKIAPRPEAAQSD